MMLSVFGGMAHIDREVQDSKKNLFYILLDLLMASLLALIYTNDLFTAYVFIEINTIAACGLIMIKKQGRTYVSALRYMIMSLVGSGLFLIGLTLLYSITGHLLMSPAKEVLEQIVAVHSYQVPLMVIIILVTVGLGIKSGLYPFHTWIPDAYGYTTPSASAVLSSLVSKGYIFLLIKIFYRVLDFDSVISSHMVNILFAFGVVGMIMGSVAAIKEKNIRRMTAYSSVAQIGYIYMGIGLGTTAGVVADKIDAQTPSADLVDNNLQIMLDRSQSIIDNLSAASASDTSSQTTEALLGVISKLSTTVQSINDTYQNQVVPQINDMISSMSDTLDSVDSMLTNLSSTAGTMSEVFTGVGDTIDVLNTSMTQLKGVITAADDKIQNTLTKLKEASEDEKMNIIINLLSGDPEKLSTFFAEPVQVSDHYIYEIANYGSGVAPFYTTLAIWVGMTILVSLVKVNADTKGLKNPKPSQLYFGRYLIFFVLSQIQTTIIVLGDLLLLKIQCPHPFAFWVTASITSLTFSLLIYSYTIAFGDIGKAFAVVIMVIQIAGSGGTYPIEALPSFFKAVYIFFPFPYAINGMRECIGGMYENTLAQCYGILGLFCLEGLIVGLVIRKPFIRLNHFIEKRMEDTEML